MKLDHSQHIPADQGDSLICELFRLARELDTFASEQTEQLDFETYAALCESEVRPLAYGNLLSSTTPVEMLREELVVAESLLKDLRRHMTST